MLDVRQCRGDRRECRGGRRCDGHRDPPRRRAAVADKAPARRHDHHDQADRGRRRIQHRRHGRYQRCPSQPAAEQQIERQQHHRLPERARVHTVELLHVPWKQEQRSAQPAGRPPVGVLAHDSEDEPRGERCHENRSHRPEAHRIHQVAEAVVQRLNAERDVPGPHQHRGQRVLEQPTILKPAHPELVDQRVGLEHASLEDDRPLEVQGRKRTRQDDRRVLETDPRRSRHLGYSSRWGGEDPQPVAVGRCSVHFLDLPLSAGYRRHIRRPAGSGPVAASEEFVEHTTAAAVSSASDRRRKDGCI